MKSINTVAGLALATFVVLALGACSSTNNGTDTSAVTPAVSAYGTCAGYTYSNGYYIPPSGGAPIPAASCTGGSGYVIPTTGYYGNNYVSGGASGCQQWSQYYYPTVYVPVNLNGQLVCVNYDYLSSQVNSSYYYGTGIDYSQYQNWYSYPPTAYDSGYYGGGYGGYSNCASNISLGFSTGSFGAGVNLCF